ncbi:hypothetical protein GGR61_002844 [Xanthomonas arboricola]|nr:hypothetical protein [Xanthomonas sp. 3058]
MGSGHTNSCRPYLKRSNGHRAAMAAFPPGPLWEGTGLDRLACRSCLPHPPCGHLPPHAGEGNLAFVRRDLAGGRRDEKGLRTCEKGGCTPGASASHRGIGTLRSGVGTSRSPAHSPLSRVREPGWGEGRRRHACRLRRPRPALARRHGSVAAQTVCSGRHALPGFDASHLGKPPPTTPDPPSQFARRWPRACCPAPAVALQ